MIICTCLVPLGNVEKAVTELMIDFDGKPEECPYEVLYNATSCHSLDSLASGRSSDKDSVNRESETSVRVRPVCNLMCVVLFLFTETSLGYITRPVHSPQLQ